MNDLLGGAADSLEIAGNYEYAVAVRLTASRIAELEASLAASNSRVELLEHDMKSGDYESLYAQTVQELEASLADSNEALQVTGLLLAKAEAKLAAMVKDAERWRKFCSLDADVYINTHGWSFMGKGFGEQLARHLDVMEES